MSKTARILLWISIMSLLGSLICMVAYKSIGVEIDEQGILQEPFALIPIGWLFIFISLVTGLAFLINRLVAAFRNKKTKN